MLLYTNRITYTKWRHDQSYSSKNIHALYTYLVSTPRHISCRCFVIKATSEVRRYSCTSLNKVGWRLPSGCSEANVKVELYLALFFVKRFLHSFTQSSQMLSKEHAPHDSSLHLNCYIVNSISILNQMD